jgi:hypothetical protein
MFLYNFSVEKELAEKRDTPSNPRQYKFCYDTKDAHRMEQRGVGESFVCCGGQELPVR